MAFALAGWIFYFYGNKAHFNEDYKQAGWFMLAGIAAMIMYTGAVSSLFILPGSMEALISAMKLYILYHLYRNRFCEVEEINGMLKMIFFIYVILSLVYSFGGTPNPEFFIPAGEESAPSTPTPPVTPGG